MLIGWQSRFRTDVIHVWDKNMQSFAPNKKIENVSHSFRYHFPYDGSILLYNQACRWFILHTVNDDICVLVEALTADEREIRVNNVQHG